MSDFGTMTTRILDDLNRNDLTSQAQDAIQTAIKFYEKRQFWFTEGRATASTVDSQEYYALPDDFLDMESLSITVSNWTYPLLLRTYNTLEDWFVKSGTYKGYPTDYALFEEQIRLYPIPNGTYTLNLSYVQKLSTLSNDTDTNAWMVEGEELIRTHAENRLYMGKLRDYDAAQATKVLLDDTVREMSSRTNSRLLTGHTKRRRM
jgi:hypothetical protein